MGTTEDGKPAAAVRPTTPEAELSHHMASIEALVRDFEAAPQAHVRNQVFALLEHLDALHRIGLTRLLALLRGNGDARLLDEVTADPLVAVLLELYGLMPGEVAAIQRTLDSYLSETGQTDVAVEVVQVVDGIVHVRFSISAGGAVESLAPASPSERIDHLEQILRRQVPGFRQIVVVAGAVPPAQAAPQAPLIPLAAVRRAEVRQAKRPQWAPLAQIGELRAGDLRGYVVAGRRIVLVCVGAEPALRAYEDRCPGSMLPLSLGTLEGDQLHCPWHGCQFEALTGRRIGAGKGLAALPLDVGDDGQVRVRIERVDDGAVSPSGAR